MSSCPPRSQEAEALALQPDLVMQRSPRSRVLLEGRIRAKCVLVAMECSKHGKQRRAWVVCPLRWKLGHCRNPCPGEGQPSGTQQSLSWPWAGWLCPGNICLFPHSPGLTERLPCIPLILRELMGQGTFLGLKTQIRHPCPALGLCACPVTR